MPGQAPAEEIEDLVPAHPDELAVPALVDGLTAAVHHADVEGHETQEGEGQGRLRRGMPEVAVLLPLTRIGRIIRVSCLQAKYVSEGGFGSVKPRLW